MNVDQPVSNHEDLLRVTDGLLQEMGLERADTGGNVTFAGLEPLRPTVLKVGAASAVVAAVGSIACAIMHRLRGGKGQDIHVDLRKAYVYQSPWQDVLVDCTKINGYSVMMVTDVSFTKILPTRDNRFVLLCALYPSQHVKIADLLRCGPSEQQAAQASRKWDAVELEAAAQALGLPINLIRSQKEFRATEQFAVAKELPLIHIEKIGESAPELLPLGAQPLSGIRALGMVHVVAGAACLRQLAAAGADSLNLNQPTYYEERVIYLQSDAGVRQAIVDAKAIDGRKQIVSLIKEADVFVENLKPHEAALQGYGAEELAAIRPGLVYVRIKLNNAVGPWADWVGFDFNAGALTGAFVDEGTMEQPTAPRSVNVVVDFLCGMLGAAGAEAALIRRAKEGGSYLVTVTLTQSTLFELSLGLNDKALLDRIAELGPERQIQKPNLVTRMTPFGEFTRLGSQVEMPETPESWADPILVPIGSSLPAWLPKEGAGARTITA
jgi:crotonobetainyl-CoA:carnitine CoA-transferase CaiB-like acyl-CoA transferase